MKEIEIKIKKEYSGDEIKKVLKKELDISNKVLTKLKTFPDGITLNGKKAFVTVKVSENDILKIRLYDKNSEKIIPSDIPLDIIFEDDDLLVLNKPRNMPTHPSLNHYTDTLANGVMNLYKDKNFTFRVITRLDRDTSGIVIVAKNKLSAQKLSLNMQKKEIKKEYYAICMNTLKNKSGRIDLPIKRVDGSGILREVNPLGKEAITDYEVVKEKDNLFLVKLNPLTGRTHQLRVHLSYLGTPIIGDSLYGPFEKGEKTLLHCKKIKLNHPLTNQEMVFDAPFPRDMEF